MSCLAHCSKRLGIGHKETTPDGLFSLEEVECIGACCWAPAVQVNYDFHDNLTPETMDKVLDDIAPRPLAIRRELTDADTRLPSR